MEAAPFTLNERIRFIVFSVTGGAGSCCKPTRKQKKYFKQKKLNDFMFCTPSSTPTIHLASIGISVASSLGAVVLASGSLSGTAAIAACLPIVVPITNALVDAGVPIGEEAKRSMAHLTTVNSLQLSFGLVEFLTGDVVNGFTHMLMAGIGFYVVNIDGIVLLPTYSVASTVFASVSVLNLVEMILYKGLPESTLPMTANFVKLATLSHPFLYMASAFLAWTLIDQLRTGLLSGIHMNAQNNISGANMAASIMMMEPTIPASDRQPFAGTGFRLENPAPPSDT